MSNLPPPAGPPGLPGDQSAGDQPAGWYPDPERPETLRYWSGRAWTDHVHAADGGTATKARRRTRPTPEPGTRSRGRPALLVALLVVVVVGAGAFWLLRSDDDPAADAGADLPPGARLHVDEDDGWELWIGSDWDTPEFGVQFGSAFWATGTADSRFADNVNVLVERLPGPVLPEDYLDAGIDQVSSLLPDAEIIDAEIVTLASGDEGVRMELRHSQPGVGQLRSLAVSVVGTESAVNVTFTTSEDRADEQIPQVEPYLRTLQVR